MTDEYIHIQPWDAASSKRARVALVDQHWLRPHAAAALLSLAMVMAMPQLIAPGWGQPYTHTHNALSLNALNVVRRLQQEKETMRRAMRQFVAVPGACSFFFVGEQAPHTPEKQRQKAAAVAAATAVALTLAALDALAESKVPRFLCSVCDVYTPPVGHRRRCATHARCSRTTTGAPGDIIKCATTAGRVT